MEPHPYPSRFLSRIALGAAFLLALQAMPHAHAATVTWDNSAGTGVWSTATNWDTNTVPVAGDTVIINNGDTVYTNVSLPALNVTISGSSVWSSNVNATTGGVIRLGGSTVTVESGSSLSGLNFWDLNGATLNFYDGAIANMTNWEYKGNNTVKFILGASGFTALTPTNQLFGGGWGPANQSYVVDFASYTGGSTTLTMIDFNSANATLNATSFLTGNFSYLNASGNYSGSMSWNDSTKAIQLAITKLPSTWAGGSGNWSAGFSPAVANGDAVKFTGAGGTATNNIASGTLSSVDYITFESGAGAYTLVANSGSAGNGSALSVTGAITNNSSSTQTINMDVAPGSIVINSGAIEIGASGRLNSGSYSNTISNSGTFIYSGTNNQTLSGVISGSGGLTKNASSTLTLSGANTYTGTTTINAGTLATSAANKIADTSAIVVNSGGTLSLGGAETVGSLSGAGSISIGGNTLTTSSSSSTTFSGNITGTSGGFTKEGTGTLTLSSTGNTWNGTTQITSGTITLSGNLSTTGIFRINGAANPVLNITGNLTSTRSSNPRNFQIAATAGNTGTVNVSGSGILNTIGMMLGENNGGNSTFNQTGGTVTSSGEVWFAGKNSTMTISGGNFFANTNFYIAGGSNLNPATNSTLTVNGTGTLSINSLQFGAGNASNTVTINIGDGTAGGNLSVNVWAGSTGPVTFNFNGGTYTANGTYSLITTNTTTVVKSGGAIFNVTGSNTLTVSNNLTTDGTGGGLTKEGTGTLTLSGAGNNYTGTTTVNAGTLTLGANQNLGAIAGAGELNLSSYTLTTNASSDTTYSGVISGSGGALTKNGTGTLTLTGANTYTGTTTVNAGTLTLGANQNLSAIAGAGELNLSSYTLTTNASSDTTYSGVISGTGALTKDGSGTLTLSSANTYTGTTTISAGTIQIGAGGTTGSLSTSSAITNNGALVFNRSNAVAQGTDFANGISGTGSLTQNGSGTLTLSSANTYTGTTTISAGTIQIGAGGTTGSLSTSSAITNNGALVFNRSNAVAQGTDFANGISGTGSLTQNGSGTLTLSSANTYSGGTTLNAGTLVIGNTAAAGTGTITQSSGSSLLKFDTTGTVANDLSIYNVSSNKTVTLSGNITAQNTTYDVASGTTTTLNGTISGSGGITKNGTGTLLVEGNNSYTGDTVVNAGTLQANAANALGNSTVMVNGGSLLVTASNAINDSKGVTLAGGTLAFNGTVSDTIGVLTLSANSVIDLGTGSVAAAFADLAMGIYNLSIYNWTGTTLSNGGDGNNTDKVYFNTALSGSELERISFYSDFGSSFVGTGFQLMAGSYQYEVIPVPEPETWATAVLLLGGMGIAYLKRKRRKATAS